MVHQRKKSFQSQINHLNPWFLSTPQARKNRPSYHFFLKLLKIAIDIKEKLDIHVLTFSQVMLLLQGGDSFENTHLNLIPLPKINTVPLVDKHKLSQGGQMQRLGGFQLTEKENQTLTKLPNATLLHCLPEVTAHPVRPLHWLLLLINTPSSLPADNRQNLRTAHKAPTLAQPPTRIEMSIKSRNSCCSRLIRIT